MDDTTLWELRPLTRHILVHPYLEFLRMPTAPLRQRLNISICPAVSPQLLRALWDIFINSAGLAYLRHLR